MDDRKKTWKRETKSEKRQIGKRFKEFRVVLKKTQSELAEELKVYQSTVTNIEVGKTFPGLKYLIHLQDSYGLNLNWLINEIDRPIIPIPKKKFRSKSYLFSSLAPTDPRLDKYQEMIDLMEIPEVEEMLFGKFTEIKLVAKKEIQDFLEKNRDVDSEPPDNPLDHGKESADLTTTAGEKGVDDVQK